MGVQERKEREKLEMKQLILETAKQVFIEEGYEKTSIRAIAERMEYSPATIYLYYKDKDELLYAVHILGFDALLALFEQTRTIQHSLERLREVGKQYLAFALENPEMYDLMFISRSPMNAISKATTDEHSQWFCGYEAFRFLCELVQENMDTGLIRTNDLYATALTIWSFVHGLASLHLRDRLSAFPDSVDTRLLIDQSLENFITLLKH